MFDAKEAEETYERVKTWATHEEDLLREGLEDDGAAHHPKKIHWHTTFGKLEVLEQIFLLNTRIYRPFVQKFRVYCRSYSRPLQRAVTDFGADGSFGQAVEKMKEHYGIEVLVCTIKKITADHAREIAEWNPKENGEVAKLLIAKKDAKNSMERSKTLFCSSKWPDL